MVNSNRGSERGSGNAHNASQPSEIEDRSGGRIMMATGLHSVSRRLIADHQVPTSVLKELWS
jgi:hypothetical protein